MLCSITSLTIILSVTWGIKRLSLLFVPPTWRRNGDYYEINGKRHASPHLFLITEIEQGILLSSYEIPKGEDKNTFSYDSMKNVDYSKLEKSEKFDPALYHEKDGIWEGGSTSQFSPVMTFKLWEKFSNNFLEVSKSMEVNGKRTFGYDEPIIYKRV